MSRSDDILTYIREELIGDPDFEVEKETSLFQDRILDSLNLVTLIGFIEKKFDIKVKTTEVTIENLDTVLKIIEFVDKKTS